MNPLRVAIVLAILCGVAAWQVSVIPESLMQMTVGATLVPAVTVAALALAGTALTAGVLALNAAAKGKADIGSWGFDLSGFWIMIRNDDSRSLFLYFVILITTLVFTPQSIAFIGNHASDYII